MAGPRSTLTRELLRDHIRAHVFHDGLRDLVGAEVELTPFAVADGLIDIQGALTAADRLWDAWPGVDELEDRGAIPWRGGRLTREPGGQYEFSGPPLETPEATACVMSQAVATLRERSRDFGFDFLAVGLHPWADAETVGLHSKSRRYLGMQTYLDAIGPSGRRMMRLTGSVQVTVDFGTDRDRAERWELAQRLAPLLTAAFGNSAVESGRPAASPIMRAQAWLHLDPKRTGIPVGFLDDPYGDPVEQYLAFALDAPVMFVARPEGSYLVPDTPMSFATWIETGMASGYPDIADWELHLSTLFPDVRPRGYLEVRALDAPGLAWIGVPILLVGHALREPSIRHELLERLRPYHDQLADLRVRAATLALGDPTLGELTRALFAAVRGVVDGPAEGLLAAYDERYIQQGMTPGEELRSRIPREGVLEPDHLETLEDERNSICASIKTSAAAIGC